MHFTKSAVVAGLIAMAQSATATLPQCLMDAAHSMPEPHTPEAFCANMAEVQSYVTELCGDAATEALEKFEQFCAEGPSGYPMMSLTPTGDYHHDMPTHTYPAGVPHTTAVATGSYHHPVPHPASSNTYKSHMSHVPHPSYGHNHTVVHPTAGYTSQSGYFSSESSSVPSSPVEFTGAAGKVALSSFMGAVALAVGAIIYV